MICTSSELWRESRLCSSRSLGAKQEFGEREDSPSLCAYIRLLEKDRHIANSLCSSLNQCRCGNYFFQAHFLSAGQTKYRKEGKRAREGSNTTFWNITHGDEPSTGKATYVPTDQETKFLLNARLGAPAQGELSQAFVSLD